MIRSNFEDEIKEVGTVGKKKALKVKTQDQTFKCDYCNFETGKKFNLSRHLSRLHKDRPDTTATTNERNSVCFHCGFTFHKITQLRQHLSHDHNMTFRTEDLHFANMKGKNAAKGKRIE